MSEELIIRHCSPTLAGLKTGNIFNCMYTSADALRKELRHLNRIFVKKGLRIVPLRAGAGTALIYVYRPARLREDLSRTSALALLKQYGYTCNTPGRCVAKLILRLREHADFPHEIGLFLGYPAEDVRGFVENKGKHEKYAGCWKVYGDKEKAQKLFAVYKKCRESYARQMAAGVGIERLVVIDSQAT